MVKKIPGQSDMFDKWSPKVRMMRRLRAKRSEAGFREVSIWVPLEKVETLRGLAASMRQACNRDFPSGTEDD